MTCILGVPLYAKFCLSRWEFGRIGWTRWWNIQIKFNTTEVRDHQVHPVDQITLGEVKFSQDLQVVESPEVPRVDLGDVVVPQEDVLQLPQSGQRG